MEDEAKMADDEAGGGGRVALHRQARELRLLGAGQPRLAPDSVDECGAAAQRHVAGIPVRDGERMP